MFERFKWWHMHPRRVFTDGFEVECKKGIRKALPYYRHAAGRNFPIAQYSLGTYYHDCATRQPAFAGDRMEKKAFFWYEKAAHLGYAPAQDALSDCYFYARGCEKNDELALYWCVRAAEQNYLPALDSCHGLYTQGIGCKADPELAAYWKERFQQEREAHPEWKDRFDPHTRKAVMEDYHEHGILPALTSPVESSPKPLEKPASLQAAEPIEKPAPKPTAKSKSAEKPAPKPTPKPAAKPVEKPATKPAAKPAPKPTPKPAEKPKPAYSTEIKENEINGKGALNYADANKAYKSGDYATAYRLMSRAADEGSPKAMYALASMQEEGKGCIANPRQALYWYEKAAKLNHPAAQFQCGWFYFNGIGCTEDVQKAFFWMERAAEQGNANAQFVYGIMCFKGNGCTANHEKGIQWLQKAAAQDHAEAIKQLKKLGL